MTDSIVTRLRQMATDRARHSTHYDGCDQSHLECAALHACNEIEQLQAIGRSHYGLHHDPMWCSVCDRAWPCPTWIQFFKEEARRG